MQGATGVGRLLMLHPTTPEGLAAKAAAICAMDDATRYTGDCRDDSIALWESLARDVAGSAYRPLGEDAGNKPV